MSDGMWAERQYFDGPIFVQFDCTNACNLRCAHCITSSGEAEENELTTEEALELIDGLADIGIFQVGFSGGEPLLRDDIFTLMERAKEKGLIVQLTTNALLVTDEVAERLKEIDPITVGVSLEGGTRETYERYRGKGNFEKVKEKIKILVDHDLPVKIKTAVSRDNIGEIDNIIDLAMDLGVKAVDMFLMYPAGRGERFKEDMLSPSEIRDFLRHLGDKKKEFNGQIEIDIDDKPNAFLVDPELSTSTCGAGLYWMEVLPNGDVVPCMFLKDLVAGNVRTNTLKEIWDSHVWEKFRDRRELKGRCGRCEYRFNCGGGCRANAYLELGDLLEEDVLCWYEPEEIEG